ncbi:MAG TPA: zf-HC2 domain-containing protein [bacterium]|nr:zf-HC2 domain-containing protein [bacterium]
MNHSKIAEKLSAYHDQRLTQPERWEVESHLEDCPSCRQTLRHWKAAAGFLFAKPRFSEWNEDLFTQKVMARLDEKPLGLFNWKPLLQWSLPLTGSLVAAAWVWGAVIPNLPGLASDNSLIGGYGTRAARSAPATRVASSASSASVVAPAAFDSVSGDYTVSFISYDGGQ